ncbi:hypothetical protein B0T16DRAFT_459834 [Cercophora newfieldiana]|uniref:Uncharacterized protein n=1 Tax=Cercophora newfieldiana TaxID=92897 RepID=A0AA39Y0G8_9PEZI|nr:hypothetical protein B0T16DRAFT_459834 [Cercophora newfieldiana]
MDSSGRTTTEADLTATGYIGYIPFLTRFGSVLPQCYLLLACVSALATAQRALDTDKCDDGHGIRLADDSKAFTFPNSTAVRLIDSPQWLIYSGPDHKFNITWRCADASLPVLVEWTVNATEGNEAIRWRFNATDLTDPATGNGTYWWRPFDALSNATFTPNVTTDKFRAQASMNWNSLSVSQPLKDGAVSVSQPFILQPEQILPFMQSQYRSGTEAEYRKWMMAVVPAVIIGILIFTLAGVYIGYAIEKRQIHKRQTYASRRSGI